MKNGVALIAIAVCLFSSAAMRVPTTGTGISHLLDDIIPAARADVVTAADETDVDAVLATIRARQAELATWEENLQSRQIEISEAEDALTEQIGTLELAEQRLAATMAQTDVAAEEDVAMLTDVYANMKPQTAAALFEQMQPEFAAGFLGRMRADVAAEILSALPPDQGYAISVVIAGRNAEAGQ